MDGRIKLLLLSLAIAGAVASSEESVEKEAKWVRRGRQMFTRLTSYVPRNRARYQLCEVDDTMGACLVDSVCRRERGLFAGYCGSGEEVCCVVDKSCDGYTRSHSSYFRNPSFPKNNTDEHMCPLTVEVGRGVCAVRLNFEEFELSPYTEGVCIGDHLTVLGTKEGSTTPVCGNMTGWTTTFAVKENSEVVLAMVLQGRPAHTFSIRVTQIGCDEVQVFHSPTYAGIRNPDAESYEPTTKKPNFVLVKPLGPTPKPGNKTTTPETTPSPDDTTEEMPKTTTLSSAHEGDDDSSGENQGDDDEGTATTIRPPVSEGPTTLMPGTIPSPKPSDVLIRAQKTDSEEEGVYLETIEATPAISAFKRAFELRVSDRCWQYENEVPSGFRVIGGGYTKINEFPWQVALVYRNKFFCGGSLISDRHILTAAHCVFGSFSAGIDRLRVSLGDHDLSTKNESNHIVGKVKHIHWNLHYNPHSTIHDIALMELEEPVTFRYGISAVKLPSDLDDLYEGENATVSGWGRYSVRLKATSPVLKSFTGPLMNISKCVEAWNKFPGISARSPNHVCLDVTMGTPCHGDSGGPLVMCSGTQCTQIGVVSFGFPMCTNVGLPAVFTRVSHYKSWIDMNLTPLDIA
ncbi:serine protease filzig-like [Penaeus japonicus]|uniref:serine protease filzig-like n=1 Tax=Penaeus japonicus TaxID=27405 RepID=UPI001C7177B5|nr:serine protease filzig-like [Penaeus japonicus]XP_042880142.1 serine protease filzig-like [Penaeus japonicus]